MPKQKLFLLHGSTRPVQSFGVFVLNGPGVKVESVELGDFLKAGSQDVPAMFRAAHAYANAHEFFTGFPTFLQEGSDFRPKHRVALLTSEVAERFDATDEELWPHPFDPLQLGHYLRVVNDQACRKGFQTGLPTFNFTQQGGKRVHQLIGLKLGTVHPYNLDAPEVSQRPEDDVAFRFAHVNKWATGLGYLGAFTVMHTRDWHRNWGERNELSRSEHDLNMLFDQGWKVSRVDVLKVDNERAALAYLLEMP